MKHMIVYPDQIFPKFPAVKSPLIADYELIKILGIRRSKTVNCLVGSRGQGQGRPREQQQHEK